MTEREERFRRLLDEGVYAALWRYACRLCARREDAQDLLQEALGRAFTRLDQLRGDASFKGWLFAIARNTFASRLRARRQRDGEAAVDQAVAAGEAEPGGPGGLHDLVRQAVELFHFEDLSLRETALALGVSENNVKQRLWRARQTLLAALSPSLRAGELARLF